MKTVYLYFSVIHLIILRSQHVYGLNLKEGDSCVNSDQTKGICTLIDNCKSKNAERRRRLCGLSSIDGSPIICCETENYLIQSKFELNNSVAALIARQKCQEYNSQCIISNDWYLTEDNSSSDDSTNDDPQKKIKPGEFPYMAAIGYRDADVEESYQPDEKKIRWLCSGSLISELFVLTNTYCTYYQGKIPTWVALGQQELDVNNLSNMFKVDKVYSRRYVLTEHDVIKIDSGLIKLDKFVHFNANISPACLQTKNTHKNKLSLTVWRKTSDGLNRWVLEQNEVNTLSKAECEIHYRKKIYNVSLKMRISEETRGMNTTICTTGGSNTNYRQILSGGTIQIPSKFTCGHHIMAVTSSFNSIREKEFYTYVYLKWIVEIVWPDSL